MPILKSDRTLVAQLAMIYTHAKMLKYRIEDVTLEEGVLIAQKLLEVIDHRLSRKKPKKP